jgi:hypothetical protein
MITSAHSKGLAPAPVADLRRVAALRQWLFPCSRQRADRASSVSAGLFRGDPVQLLVTASVELGCTQIRLGLRVEHRHLRAIAMIVLSPDDPPSGRPVRLHLAMVDHAVASKAARTCRVEDAQCLGSFGRDSATVITRAMPRVAAYSEAPHVSSWRRARDAKLLSRRRPA